MNNLAVINSVSVEFSVVGDEVFADTLKIAEVFGKNHQHILRTIKNLPNDDFKSENFKSSTYLDAQMKPRPCYNLTRDGFSLLVMGFTGQKAYQWKIEFIKAFNTMEAKLKRQSVSCYVDKIASLEAVRISQNDHHQRQINGYKSQISRHNTQIATLKRQLKKAQKADIFAGLDLSEAKFQPFSQHRPSYKELWFECINILGERGALKAQNEALRAQNEKLALQNKRLLLILGNINAQVDIKFRAWHKEHKRFITLEKIHFDENGRPKYVYGQNELSPTSPHTYSIEDIELVMSSGITDKNGNKIYEGDIVMLLRDDYKTGLGVVKWDDNKASFIIDCGITVFFSETIWIEILDNIYENPELSNEHYYKCRQKTPTRSKL